MSRAGTGSGGRRKVSVIVQQDGASQSSTYRIPIWAFRIALVGGVALTILVVLGVAFYGPIARQAWRVPQLEREVDRLHTDNLRVRELAAAMDSVLLNYERLRSMVGADIVPDPVILRSPLPVAPPLFAASPDAEALYEIGASVPRYWPLVDRGYVTRGQALADSTQEVHPGIDIAVPVGSVVRASGGGVVLQTGEHNQYGRFVLLEHPDGYRSMYGHLSRVIAVQGAIVNAGMVIGRSGNTGRSSAPHLHFEIRLNGISIDPESMVKEVQ